MTNYQILRRMRKIRNMVGYIPNSKEYAWDEIVKHLVEPSLEYLDELILELEEMDKKDQEPKPKDTEGDFYGTGC